MQQQRWPLSARPLATLALLATMSSTAFAQFGTNLIVNGGAEGGPTGLTAPGWAITGSGRVRSYTGGGGYPTATDPGPINRGSNFFSGADDIATSVFSQTLNLGAIAGLSSQIAAGTVTFTFSAFLGGFASQADNATLSAQFLNAGGGTLQTFTLGPVTPGDRNFQTGLLQRLTSGVVPPGTVNVLFTLTMTRLEGTANDGYADELSFVLGSNATPPTPNVVPEPASVLLLGGGLGLLGLVARRKPQIT